MHTGCTRQLCQTADSILYIIGSHHHQICQLIYDNNDLRHLFRFVFSRNLLDGFYFLIIAFHVTDTVFLEGLIALHHL